MARSKWIPRPITKRGPAWWRRMMGDCCWRCQCSGEDIMERERCSCDG